MTKATMSRNQLNEMGKSETLRKKIKEIHNKDRGKL